MQGTIESVFLSASQCGMETAPARLQGLQRVVRLAERISGSALPSLQDIYIKRCRGRADKIIKDSNHPGNCLFTRLPSGKRFPLPDGKNRETQEEFLPTAIRLLNSKSAA